MNFGWLALLVLSPD